MVDLEGMGFWLEIRIKSLFAGFDTAGVGQLVEAPKTCKGILTSAILGGWRSFVGRLFI